MSAKKEGKSAPAAKAAPATAAKKEKVHPSLSVKRNEDGTKKMKVARGTERARRRQGLRQDWKNIGNAAKMLPTKAEEAAKEAA